MDASDAWCFAGALVISSVWLLIAMKLPGRRHGDVRAERVIGFLMLFGGLALASTAIVDVLTAGDCVDISMAGRRSSHVEVLCRGDGPVVLWGTVLSKAMSELLLAGVGGWFMAGRKQVTT